MIQRPQLEYYVPFQFFLNHNWKILIGITTSSLFFPDNSLDNVKQIELLDLLNIGENTKIEMKNFLLKWNPRLLYPKDFGELEEMIK